MDFGEVSLPLVQGRRLLKLVAGPATVRRETPKRSLKLLWTFLYLEHVLARVQLLARPAA